MSEDYVVDASVGIKLFVEEEESQLAQTFFEKLTQKPPARFYVPDLFFIECANILWKYVWRFNYPPKIAQQNITALTALNLRTVSMSDLLEDSFKLALQHHISTYDASYVALSQRLNLPLITADTKLISKLADSDIQLRTLSGSLEIRGGKP